LKWHPDKNAGSDEATEMFKSISEAYAVLSNPERRKRYDLWGETG
jgi:DnaJ-class molecular chaperone